jgi:hypothetical protein
LLTGRALPHHDSAVRANGAACHLTAASLGARSIAAMILAMTMMMTIADAHADTGNINMHLRHRGRSEGECRCTGDTENQISHFFDSLGLIASKRIAFVLVHKFLAEPAFMVSQRRL